MPKHRTGIIKVVVIVVLAVLVAVAFTLMSREQEARRAAQTASETLTACLDDSPTPTPEQVHEKLGQEPQVTREPGKHRMVEEYIWKGPMGSSHTVYAYYTTGSTKLLEAVSINKKHDKYEGDAIKAQQR